MGFALLYVMAFANVWAIMYAMGYTKAKARMFANGHSVFQFDIKEQVCCLFLINFSPCPLMRLFWAVFRWTQVFINCSFQRLEDKQTSDIIGYLISSGNEKQVIITRPYLLNYINVMHLWLSLADIARAWVWRWRRWMRGWVVDGGKRGFRLRPGCTGFY